jgi:hypothetical protein
VAALGRELVTPLAHAGHWLASVAYAAPVIALVVWMVILKVRDVRARRREAAVRPPED